jgi:hypothetical protein
MPFDIHSVWQAQPFYLQPPTPENLRRRARQLRIERLAALISGLPFVFAASVIFSLAAVFADTLLIRIGCAIIAASLMYSFVRFVGSEWRSDPATDCVAHYRAQLTRRIAFLGGFAHHDALPISIGIGIAMLGWFLAEPHRWPEIATAGVLGIGLQFALASGNTRRIARLQKELLDLDAITSPPDTAA